MDTNQIVPSVLIAPGRYIQGRGAIRTLGQTLNQMGSHRPLLLLDPVAAKAIGSALEEVAEGIPVNFGGECSPEEIDRVAGLVHNRSADAIVAIGGGKTIDTAKSVAHPAGIKLVVVPTIASTDAPTSALAVIYTKEGEFKEYRFFGKNPDVVLVDTDIIAHAPVRFLVAGMGDALSTYFEADACYRTRRISCAGGAPTRTALSLARLCYDLLQEYGVEARLAVEQGAVTTAVERIVEANTLLSGLGFESCGLAAAHAIHNGLTVLPGTHHYWHGEKVALGTVTMLMLEDRPTELVQEVFDFCLKVGLPVCLKDVGLEGASREELRKVAEAACAPGETIHNEPFTVYPEMVVDAILAADAYGRQRRTILGRSLPLPDVAH